MKNTIKKNNLNTSFVTFLFLLLFLGSSQWLLAQPLLIDENKVQINFPLEVNKTSTFDGPLIVNKSATFKEDLTASGSSTFTGKLTASGSTTFTGELIASGSSSFTGKLTASGSTTFTGNVGIGTTDPGGYKLNVNGPVFASGFNMSNKIKLDIHNGDPIITFSHAGIARIGGATRGLGIWGGEKASKDDTPALFINPDNLVSIGFTVFTPQEAQLHVAGPAAVYGSELAGLIFKNSGGDMWKRVYVKNREYRKISILAEGDIITKTGLFTTSDIRIKKNISLTSTLKDLQSLKAIEIVNYEMIDDIADNRSYKKVIAQQLEEVYPIAVQQATQGFIPSVFQPSISFDKITTGEYQLVVAKEHHLAVNDKLDLKCYPGNSSVIAEVIRVISPKEFVVQSTTELDNMESIFVYGKQVDDLLSVDYDAISMLNVSATQELAKQTEQLQAENQALTARVAELEKQLESMDELKASVAQLQAMMQDKTAVNSSAIFGKE
ncbi:MAG: tail fiber domain-containing protein [Saprospiraceae bacterium]|nr:tail fiber domain-containing protein [Saprospiraceae bacterium]MCB9324982.1 tail fiber domain-containing protein [Lewinellaceae bacterium]